MLCSNYSSKQESYLSNWCIYWCEIKVVNWMQKMWKLFIVWKWTKIAFFKDSVLMCSANWPGTFYVDQTGLTAILLLVPGLGFKEPCLKNKTHTHTHHKKNHSLQMLELGKLERLLLDCRSGMGSQFCRLERLDCPDLFIQCWVRKWDSNWNKSGVHSITLAIPSVL